MEAGALFLQSSSVPSVPCRNLKKSAGWLGEPSTGAVPQELMIWGETQRLRGALILLQ